MDLEIEVTKINGDAVTIRVQANSTIWQAKRILQPLLQIPASEQVLLQIEGGTILEDHEIPFATADARTLQVVVKYATWLEAGEYSTVKQLGCKSTSRSSGLFYTADLVTHNGSKFVIKSINCSSANETQKRRAMHDARKFVELRHPNIVRHYEVFVKCDQQNWILSSMDYCPISLTSTLLKAREQIRPLPAKRVMQWFMKALGALAYLHDSNILHRDLKCSKVFQTRGGDLQIGGLAPSQEWNLTGAGNYGSIDPFPRIPSPECCSHNCPYSWRCDIWSMGLILFAMCALQPPFGDESIWTIALQLSKGRALPPLPCKYVEDVGPIYSKMVSMDSALRPTAKVALEEVEALCCVHSPLPQNVSQDAVVSPPLQKEHRSLLRWQANLQDQEDQEDQE